MVGLVAGVGVVGCVLPAAIVVAAGVVSAAAAVVARVVAGRVLVAAAVAIVSAAVAVVGVVLPAAGVVVLRFAVVVAGFRVVVRPFVGCVAAVVAAAVELVLRGAGGGAGEGVGGEFELFAGDGGHGGLGADVGGDFGGVVGGELFCPVADGVAEAFTGCLADAVGESAFAAEAAGDGAADRSTGSGLPHGGEVVAGEFAVALGGLDQPDTQIQSALFQSTERGFFHDSGEDPLEQLFHQHADGDLGGHAGGGAGGRAGGGADTGGHRRECCGHFHGEDHQLGDDHQLGVFDVVGAVVDDIGLIAQ
ncbi:hypothetical protein IU441_18160 [Nocardia cyriacigeorgica]|uniref:hypothetical protein n=1 Tax=Nocardia cyriacigeorgica TaxID=135487 RepID=UPI001893B2B5|nr:hypothetical protein [Nocardia cyriacigeorgica]MBF6415095.1 hypothetical protein [Nocardia cyriacigeorgica]